MKDRKTKWITGAVFLIAVSMIVLGIRNGEVGVIFTRATSICLQCIGIN